MLSDCYSAYASYAKANDELIHAPCWVHSRRQFIEAEKNMPELDAQAISQISTLYQIEETIQQQKLSGEKKRDYRLQYSKPIVDGFFDSSLQLIETKTFLPKDPLLKAINYVRSKETALRVFLKDRDIPMDTNHLERALRPIPMDRKNWLFCWTDLGAEHVGVIQSLVSTCKLHDINVYDYLTDVLLHINQHSASKVHELTPRLWKAKFEHALLRSDLLTYPDTAVK